MRWRPPSVLLLAVWLLSSATSTHAQTCPLFEPLCCASDADCDDGDPCNGAETCDAGGSCVLGVPLLCEDDGNPCTSEQCVPGVGCHAPVSGSCNDGLFCNGDDTCQNGECVHSGNPCLNGPECGNVCKEGTGNGDGTCAVADGTPCGNDGNPCTFDRCNEGQCKHPPNDAASCSDGSLCTTNDHCSDGSCVGTPKTCPASDECHQAGTCDPGTGACTAPAQPDGTPCTSDGVPCTADECRSGACAHPPADDRCDDGSCTQGACRPGVQGADAKGCVSVPVLEGEPCTDDGVACTDDVCTGGTCLHVPVDTRCAASNQCTPLVCAPEEQDANADGCAASSTPVAGGTCGEDGDPCSDDLCRDATCEHVRIAEWQTCQPVQDAFRKSLALVSLARGLHAAVAPAAATGATPAAGGGMATPLVRAESDLQAVVSMLAGHGVEPTTVDGIPETPAQARARTALRQLVRTPADVRAFLAMARTRPGRQTLGPDLQRAARTRGAVLLRGTKSLKGELRRLQQVSRTFAR